MENKCLFCGKPIKPTAKYCSNKCQLSFQRQEYIKKLEAGEVTGGKGKFGISNCIRSFLFELHNYKCQLCGWGERNLYTGTLPLEVHHIDGDHTNNKLSNLQLLCPNCHSLTATHKKHNKHSTRKNRNKQNDIK